MSRTETVTITPTRDNSNESPPVLILRARGKDCFDSEEETAGEAASTCPNVKAVGKSKRKAIDSGARGTEKKSAISIVICDLTKSKL